MEIPFGYIEENVLYRAAFGNIKALKLKEITEEELTGAIEYHESNFKRLSKKLEAIEIKINSENNKGSFLSSLLNIKFVITTHNGLGDYQALLDKIAPLESFLEDYVKKNRVKNTDIKKALLLELEVVLGNNDQEEALEQIKDLKSRWLKTGSAALEVRKELEQNFKNGIDQFFEKKNTFSEDKKRLIESRVNDYQEIIKKIELFISKKQFGDTFDEVKDLQKQWKEIGHVPESEYKRVNDAYWKVSQRYFAKQKKQRSEERKDRGKNEKQSLATRKEIIDQLKLLTANGFNSTKREYETLKNNWKSSGSLSKKAHADIHTSFMSLSREFQERQFIAELAKKKNKGFAEKAQKEQLKDLIKVIRTLLTRDEHELNSFMENMDKMHINKGSFVDMLEEKLKVQRGKVDLKRGLLKECQEKIKQL